jgi:hydrogenase expression/formation protein HypD
VIRLAGDEPETTFVFLAVGFETTAPGTALLLAAAERDAIPNILVLTGHKLVPPALEALLSRKDLAIDGLVLPGHVSVILGAGGYSFLPDRFGIAGAICGFEPADLLAGILELIEMRLSNSPRIANLYSRYVREEGNVAARALMSDVFSVADSEWRGLGMIPGSGLVLATRLAHRDATMLLDAGEVRRVWSSALDHPGCRCGEVLCGTVRPPDCDLFGGACTPETPVGPCMVSTEGTCAAYYRYGRGPCLPL